MPFDTRQIARLRPTAVAVHDHRDVLRQALEVDFFEESFLDRSRLSQLGQVDHLERVMLTLRKPK